MARKDDREIERKERQFDQWTRTRVGKNSGGVNGLGTRR